VLIVLKSGSLSLLEPSGPDQALVICSRVDFNLTVDNMLYYIMPVSRATGTGVVVNTVV
jgi:hypothetical protein